MNKFFPYIPTMPTEQEISPTEAKFAADFEAGDLRIASNHEWLLRRTIKQGQNPSRFTIDDFYIVITAETAGYVRIEAINLINGSEGGTYCANDGLEYGEVCKLLKARAKLAKICDMDGVLSIVIGDYEKRGNTKHFSNITHILRLTRANQAECSRMIKKMLILVKAQRDRVAKMIRADPHSDD